MISGSMDKIIVVIPAYNEEESLGPLLSEMRTAVPELDVLVVNDGSADRTADVAAAHGAAVLDLPCQLGVGGAVQAGLRYAFEHGYTYVVRCDAAGPHPPGEIPKMLAAVRGDGVDLVIGSRFLGLKTYGSTVFRYCGIMGLAAFLSLICRKRVTDPTSGFQALSRPLMYFFSRSYPADYPEPEALALMRRQGYDFVEVPVAFRERAAGRSSIRGWGTLYYVLKVFLALCVDRARSIDPNYSRTRVVGRI